MCASMTYQFQVTKQPNLKNSEKNNEFDQVVFINKKKCKNPKPKNGDFISGGFAWVVVEDGGVEGDLEDACAAPCA